LAFYLIGGLFFARTWPPGFATITVLLLGSLSLNALFLGVIGEYLGRMYRQMKKGPLTIIQEEIDPAGEQRLSESQIRAVAAPEFRGNR
jgi:dolichol-phosphate mannosyltransferase